MIEEIIISYLSSYYSDKVFAEKPNNGLTEYILVEKTGGYREDYVDHATIAVQSHSGSMYEAAVLNDAVKEYMLELPMVSDEICDCTLNSDYVFTDTSTKEYRYQAVFDITY